MNKEPSLDYIIEDLVKSLRGTEEDWQIKSIKAFILKALKSQREEIVENEKNIQLGLTTIINGKDVQIKALMKMLKDKDNKKINKQ